MYGRLPACARFPIGLGRFSTPRPYTVIVTPTGIEPEILRFGAFELDVRNNELRRAGVLVKLAPQQLRILRFLAENAGRVCTREEIQGAIWGNDVFVDFDRGLNVSIAQIRSALNDDSEAPRFIQTIPRRGYKFVAPVEQPAAAIPATPEPAVAAPPRRWWWIVALVIVFLTAASLAVWRLWPREPVSHRIMLAVLPFETVTQAPDDAPFIDGLSDELITQFGAVQPQRLGVIGRTSVLHYAGRRPGLPQIARDLSVEYVIEGDLRRENGRVRISVRLVKASDQSQVWNETYEHDANGLEAQEEIAAHVTAAVVHQLFPGDPAPSARAHMPAPAAYDAFVKGRYLTHRHTREDMERAIAQFEEAARLDTAFAEPLAEMSHTYVGLTMAGVLAPADGFEKARAAAEHALKIDDSSAEAHSALASVLFWRDWNWNEAQRHFERAIAINPSYAQAQHDYAFYLIATGHPEAGVAALRRAIAIDPLSPRVNVDAGWVLLQAHHFDQAIAQAKRALDLEPGMAEARACIARAEQYQDKSSAAALEFYRAKLAQPEKSSAYDLALAYAVLGRNDDAIRSLQTAYEQHAMLMPLMRTEPSFTALHSDSRFGEILRKLGLPE